MLAAAARLAVPPPTAVSIDSGHLGAGCGSWTATPADLALTLDGVRVIERTSV
ncbi:hypothetical protein ACFPOI_48365 [Nonomuraea angiospora]|uniref:Uncharacterized protein n=1 Tax=Nonomuraea angiospora TaxID=46172 RepID=A0ABR9LXI4_9ACTN|nr:hypothetical protein [Nonomuraea angiospora]MBE1585353.1 hypothetical protein [Nonomuraea angiospora]